MTEDNKPPDFTKEYCFNIDVSIIQGLAETAIVNGDTLTATVNKALKHYLTKPRAEKRKRICPNKNSQ